MQQLSIQDRHSFARALTAMGQHAAQVLMEGYRKSPTVSYKGPLDLVTEYDQMSEAILRSACETMLPGLALVCEESGGQHSLDAPTLYIDPLDGTTNFAHGHPVFAVSLGVVSADGPEVGVVIAPALGLTWVGVRGDRTTRNGERVRVSTTERLDRSLLGTGFPYDRRSSEENNLREFAHIEAHIAQGVRRLGSAACDLCFVSDGTYDGYWESKLQPWDIAAGAACVLAAGGTLTATRSGAPFDTRTGDILATNGLIHQGLQQALRLS
ncbi:MAG: inositol monophosphatase family protein [Deltaproteobacteria bacterium]|nr:inositol monophosphatase family protein [Deltaproteobacteria bacterium]